MDELDQTVAVAEMTFPQLWPTVHPRCYNGMNGFSSPKHLAADLLALLIQPPIKQSEIKELPVLLDKFPVFAAVCMATLQVPIFFAKPDLLRALSQTAPPAAIRWDEMKLPFEACGFMLPRDLLVHPVLGECRFFWYARLKAGITYRHPFHPNTTYRFESDHFLFRVCFGSVAKTQDLLLNQTRNPIFENLGVSHRFVVLNDNETADRPSVQSIQPPPFTSAGTGPELELLYSSLTLLVDLLLVMLERPHLVEKAKFSGKRSKKGTEFWTPNFIGREYCIPTVRQPGEPGISPRMHWRRGHWTQQPFGPKSALRKQIWIDPLLVASP